MIITIVCDVLGEPNNGTSLAAYNLINSLKDKGYTVRVVCPDLDKKGMEGYYILPTFNLGPINSYVKKNGVSLSKGDLKIIKEACEGADAVHCMFGFSAGCTAAKYCYENDIPVTGGFHCQSQNFTSHIFSLKNPFANWLVYKIYSRNFYRYLDGTHFPTQFIKDIADEYNMITGKPYIISNGVKLDVYHRNDAIKLPEWKDKFVITMSGRYCKEKSQKTLIQAIKYSKYQDRIQLVFAGDGPLKDKYIKMTNKFVNKPLFKRFTHNELANILNMSDLYVHTSYAEIEAISCLEAMACGLVPIISNSRYSATKKFALSEENLFEYNNPVSLAKQIDYWLEHEEERKSYSLKYQEFVKQFEYNHCMDLMEKMIIDNIKEKHKTHLSDHEIEYDLIEKEA